MDKHTSELFFENVRWFNNFFADMKTLLDRIGDLIEKETPYDSKWLYYYKSSSFPSIPSVYFLGMEGEGQLKLQIIAIFDDAFVKNSYLAVNEPGMVIIQHDYESNDQYIGWNILENKGINKIIEKDGLVFGELGWGDGIEFTAFSLPLDVFSKYDDSLVLENIINKLH